MTELTGSIKANGLLNPIIVRSKADGRFELISGHRRKRAYEILKINKIRAIIVDVTDDEAIIMMADNNCQRSKILPSEKAFSYKMKLEAIKRQGTFHFAVVPWGVRTNKFVLDTTLFERTLKQCEIVGFGTTETFGELKAVVGLNALHRNALF